MLTAVSCPAPRPVEALGTQNSAVWGSGAAYWRYAGLKKMFKSSLPLCDDSESLWVECTQAESNPAFHTLR